MVTEGGPVPKLLMANIDMSISPSTAEHGSGLMEGTVQTPCSQDEGSDAGIVRESQSSPVFESENLMV